MKKIFPSLCCLCMLSFILMPSVSLAADTSNLFGGLIPCGQNQNYDSNTDDEGTQVLDPSTGNYVSAPAQDDKSHPCGLDDFVTLIKNVINALLVISIPLATIAFTYVGIILLTAQGNTAKITEAKGVAKNVGIGFIFIISAWLIVHTIAVALLNKDIAEMFLKK